MAKADVKTEASPDYESMSAADLTALSVQLDDERTTLNAKIAAVNEVRGRKEAADAEAERAAAAPVETPEGLSIAPTGAESAEGVGPE